MGIKTKIKKEQLPLKYQKYNLIETSNGNTDSVYLLGNTFVLKLYENTLLETIINEQKLLNKLDTLKVPKIIDIFKLDNKNIAISTQIDGISIEKSTLVHIKQVGLFLKQFHNISKNLESTNINIYSHSYLKKLIDKANNIILKKYFDNIDINLTNDGIIHGDIFYDNVKFKDNKLSGVYDFTEACNGDFKFELAVVVISWCFNDDILNNEKLNTLLFYYGLDIKYDDFKEYIKYALVYYATTRYIDNRDYQELLNKLDNI
ncbi:MAG: phosphotransferase [Campylobacterota bacterium]|nr:phosphotransferase [Campylobacterota bacterium]